MCRIIIELHGYFQNIAVEFRARIIELTADKDYGNRLSVRIFLVEVVDVQGTQQPFIRLLCDENALPESLLKALLRMNERLEYCTLTGKHIALYNRQSVEL